MNQKDDFIMKTCDILGTQIKDEVAYFLILVTSLTGEKFCSSKRYSDFEEFHQLILDSTYEDELPSGVSLPGKRLSYWYNHQSPSFLEERAVLLENYLNKTVQVKTKGVDKLLLGFLASGRIHLSTIPPQTSAKTLLASHTFPEDCEVTGASIEQVRVMKDHVLFIIDLECKGIEGVDDRNWTVIKRANNFYDLDLILRDEFKHRMDVLQMLPTPPERYSKWFVDHMDRHFIEHRRILLENYLRRLILIQPVLFSQAFNNFICA